MSTEDRQGESMITFDDLSHFSIVSWARDHRNKTLLTSGIDWFVQEQIQHA